ncbi:ABC transporter ATP-binding protein [Streptomyces sp. NPDC002812]|uniref:ABC transporter ATP-binding protein n=1 Tax=unclassified Streptomyces TaxID=2593676 RepID=UPI002030BDB4|nr:MULTISPECIES: ABC transporter ATP-binding protein [unclassified Streptomyces]MCM1965374.1 ABC transporter ATP-binding protein/permease [Streptomyces sp. G1]MCX5130033.1 ABC transporter ATP-binding protein/permease [Streptomyces sp. NBC_00347]MCX5301072.1 ABC transporter ATP-binding protein/permease [Streptomyces sp. NBC_00193]
MTTTAPAEVLDGKETWRTLLRAVRRFLPYLKPHWFWLSVATAMAVVNTIATIAVMYTVMAGIGHIVIGDMEAVRSTALNLVLLTVVENVIRITYNSAMIRVNERLTVTIRNDLVARLHNVQLSRHVSQASGEWVTRVLFEANRFRGFLTKTLMEVTNSVIWFIAFAVFLLALSPAVALPTLVIIPLMTWISVKWTVRLRPDTHAQREGWDQMVGYMNQRIDGLEDIRSFGQEEAVLADLRGRSEEYSTVHNRLSRKRLWLTSHLGFSVFLALALLIFFGGLQIINGHQLGSGFFFDMASGMMPMTWMLLGTDTMMASMGMASGTALAAGTLAAFALFVKRMLNPVRDLAGMIGQSSDMAASAARILDVLDLEEEQGGSGTLPPVEGAVAIEDVTFAYGADGPEVLHGITLRAEPGQHIGIVGTSGAGKSTLMQLLVRLYTPTSGTVRIDGHDLTDMSSSSVRSQVLLVTQEAQLFDGTVAENILFGRPEATEEQVVEAARAVGAYEVISDLRNGFQTRVGERGSRLSVGERQIIALARAMLADPRVIVLDEAISSVDPDRQRIVFAAIRRLLEGRTAIVVAHWLTLVEDLDQVFVLEDGRIVESGRPVELLTAGGRLTELCQAQEGRTHKNTTGKDVNHV